jgi:peptidoglycan/xylan/chitin deacetylase (PgdA/CDA1 family)
VTPVNGRRWLLLRYDTESRDAEAMTGFLGRVASAHRGAGLPVTLFCTGGALDAREAEFRAFADATAGDPLFEIGDHSYSHVGVGYESGPSVADLQADYERSLHAHERVLGARPDSVSLCGTSGDGPRLSGFDATPKAREELAMLASLGFRRVNAFRSELDKTRDFTDYASFGLPDVKGFPSAFSDTEWLWRAGKEGDFLAPLRAELDKRAAEDAPLPVILHDWVAWLHAPDQALTHVLELADYARTRGFVPLTIGEAVRRWEAESAIK